MCHGIFILYLMELEKGRKFFLFLRVRKNFLCAWSSLCILTLVGLGKTVIWKEKKTKNRENFANELCICTRVTHLSRCFVFHASCWQVIIFPFFFFFLVSLTFKKCLRYDESLTSCTMGESFSLSLLLHYMQKYGVSELLLSFVFLFWPLHSSGSVVLPW